MTDLIRMAATEIVEKLKAGAITPLDCLDALERRVGEVDGAVNALPTLCFERARQHARRLMARPAAERGTLAGLPVPIKDLVNVAGVRSTQGSPIYRDHVAETSDLLVTHLEGRGGIVYAMSNTPEFKTN
ncbi:amidase family protein, partial [Aestuariivirga sp.]|uniref:amidase family protein n=1 Tax=Aestuariivirga sp. TaxID=2650926 RepID=UPI00391C42E7